MTKKEKEIYDEWRRNMLEQDHMIDTYYEKMRTLYEKHQGKKAPYDFDICYEDLIRNEDKSVSDQATSIMKKYCYARGQMRALRELTFALTSARQTK